MSITDEIRKLSNEQLIAEAKGWQTTPHGRVLGERLEAAVRACRDALVVLEQAESCKGVVTPVVAANLRAVLREVVESGE